MDHKVLKALLVFKVTKVLSVIKAFKEYKVHKDLLVSKVITDSKDMQVLTVAYRLSLI